LKLLSHKRARLCFWRSVEETLIRAFVAICSKSRFACDLKDCDFLHCEFLSAREELLLLSAEAVVLVAKAESVIVCFALQLSETAVEAQPPTICSMANLVSRRLS
jgi:hypothetical protein